MVLDKFSSHRAKDAEEKAEELGIELVFLPPYSARSEPDRADLERSVIVSERVYGETVKKGKEKGYEDAVLIEETAKDDLIEVKEVEKPELIDRANKFNIQAGEAEAAALYWQEEADLLMTDDDNVRKKSAILELNLIGTPVIIWKLFESGKINRRKVSQESRSPEGNRMVFKCRARESVRGRF